MDAQRISYFPDEFLKDISSGHDFQFYQAFFRQERIKISSNSIINYIRCRVWNLLKRVERKLDPQIDL